MSSMVSQVRKLQGTPLDAHPAATPSVPYRNIHTTASAPTEHSVTLQ